MAKINMKSIILRYGNHCHVVFMTYGKNQQKCWNTFAFTQPEIFSFGKYEMQNQILVEMCALTNPEIF